MFGDWDFFNTRGTNMTIDDMDKIIKVSQEVIANCFPYKSKYELRTIMCYASRKEMVDKDGDEIEKDGCPSEVVKVVSKCAPAMSWP